MLLTAFLLAAAPQNGEHLILQADALLLPDCNLEPGGYVLLKGDRIQAAGAAVPRPKDAPVVRLSGVLAPGFVDAFTRAGLADNANESTAAVTPNLLAADSIDWNSPLWQRLLPHGVTAVHLVPEPADSGPGGNFAVNAVAGWSALVAGGGAEPRAEARARQVFGLHDAEFDGRRAIAGPTGLPGALEAFERALAGGIDHLSERGALFQVESGAAVRAARARARVAGFGYAFVARGDVGSYGGDLRGELVGLPAWSDGEYSLHGIETWRRLHAAGVKIAFGSDVRSGALPAPAALRTSAMAFARATGDAPGAMASITSHAADLAGDPRRGRIASGARADLVLWSGHPLDSASRVLTVMVGGQIVYSASRQ